MSYRGQCPNCGKVLVIGQDEVGRTAVCGACGTRFAVRLHEANGPVHAPPHGRPAPRDAGQSLHANPADLRPPVAGMQAASTPGLLAAMGEGAGDADAGDAASAAPAETSDPLLAAAVSEPRLTRGQAVIRRAGVSPVMWIGAAAAVVIAGTVALVLLLSGAGKESSAAKSGEVMRRNADLIALKDEAEALVGHGKVTEAHEKYRELFRLAAGRELKDPVLWEMLERARADQDRVYQIVLNRIQAQDEADLVSKGLRPWPQPAPITPGAPGGDPAAAYPGWSGAAAASNNGENGAPEAPPPTPATPTAAVAAAPSAPAPSTPAPSASPPPSASPSPAAPSTSPASPSATPATQPASPASPAGQPAVAANLGDPAFLTDEEIGEALQRGVDYLLSQFKGDEIGPVADVSDTYRRGLDALCVYALLTAGQATHDPRLDPKSAQINAMLQKLRSYPLVPSTDPTAPYDKYVYARSFRAAALSVYNRPEDRNALKNDVEWLIAAHINGAYTYDDRFTGLIRQDGRPRNGTRADGPGGAPARRTSDERRPDNAPRRDDVMLRAMPAEALSLYDGSAEVIPVDGVHGPGGVELGRPWRRTTLPPHSPRSKYAPKPPPGTPRPLPGGPPRTNVPPAVVLPPRVIATAPPPPWSKQPPLGMSGPSTRPANLVFPWDNSNSQYGLLGVWSGAEVGVEVPTDYWRAVQKHWTSSQLPSGQWAYRAVDKEPTHAMTTAGIASLFVTHDWLDAASLQGALGREPLTKPLAAGLAWLEQGDNAVGVGNHHTHYLGYDLYGLERVALASGFKYFGKHDWYRELAAKVVQDQHPNGAWGREDSGADSLIDTAYMLLFLSRGRHPVIMNKLRFDGDATHRGYWANRPRDLANLARYVSRNAERTVNWQVVSFEREATDWLDSPILYIASHKPPPLTDEHYKKLQQFIEAGGLIFTHADGGSMEFTRWVETELVKRIANKYELIKALPESHDLYSINFKIKGPKPRLMAVDSGSRLLLVHSPEDMASIWQQRSDRVKPTTYELATNLFLYASGKAELRNRLASPHVPAPKEPPQQTIKVARLKYGGNWDPEPGAWPRFARWMQWDTRSAPHPQEVAMSELKADSAPVAHLTGNVAYQPTDAEVAAVRAYVEAGGVLLIDVCGGLGAFGESIEKSLLAKAFPSAQPEALKAGDAPLRLPGLVNTDAGADASAALAAFDLSKARLRTYAAEKLAPVPAGNSRFKVVRFGKGVVIYSPLDLTTGILGSNTWGNLGYHPDYAQAFVRNLLMWAVMPDRDAKPAATQPAGGVSGGASALWSSAAASRIASSFPRPHSPLLGTSCARRGNFDLFSRS